MSSFKALVFFFSCIYILHSPNAHAFDGREDVTGLVLDEAHISETGFTFNSKVDNLNWVPQSLSGEAYYLGDEAHETPVLAGRVYVFSSKKCYYIKRDLESSKTKKQVLYEIPCEPRFVALATEPYLKTYRISDFYNELKKCVDAEDRYCLRRLVYKDVKINHNLYYGQERDYAILLSKKDVISYFKKIVNDWNLLYEFKGESAIPKLGICSGLPYFSPLNSSKGEILLTSWTDECEE